MKNHDNWRPSQYVIRNGKLISTRDQGRSVASSQWVCDLIAEFYEHSIPRHARGKLLDLGCGNAPLFNIYKDIVSEVVSVVRSVAIDDSKHVDCECDLEHPLPFSDGTFDTIIFTDFFEQLADPVLLWDEMARILSTNGKIIMNGKFIIDATLEDGIHEQPSEYQRYAENELEGILNLVRLKLIRMTAMGGDREVLADNAPDELLDRLSSKSASLHDSEIDMGIPAQIAVRFRFDYCSIVQKTE